MSRLNSAIIPMEQFSTWINTRPSNNSVLLLTPRMSRTHLKIKVPLASTPPTSGILKVSGRKIVGQDGKLVILRGAGLGRVCLLDFTLTATDANCP